MNDTEETQLYGKGIENTLNVIPTLPRNVQLWNILQSKHFLCKHKIFLSS